MKMYLYCTTDCTPDSCRSSKTSDTYGISTSPCETNMSHEERTSGDCGTTNDQSLTAMGEFDSDADVADEIISSLPSECNSSENRENLLNWISQLSDEEQDGVEDFIFLFDDSRESQSATWNPSDENWFPVLKPGWETLVGTDDNETTWPLDRDDRDALDEIFGDTFNAVEYILDTCNINYDNISCENIDSGGTSSWKYFNVRIEDYHRAYAALKIAAGIAQFETEKKNFKNIFKNMSTSRRIARIAEARRQTVIMLASRDAQYKKIRDWHNAIETRAKTENARLIHKPDGSFAENPDWHAWEKLSEKLSHQYSVAMKMFVESSDTE